MLHLRKLAFAAFCILALTGCPAPPKRVARPIPLESSFLEVQSSKTNGFELEKAVVTNAAPTVLPLSVVFTNQWTSLGSFALWLNGGAMLQARATHSNGAFELRHSNGVLCVTAGSRIAHWNGLALNLGFPPRQTNGELYIHSLDLFKNLQPLLVPEPPKKLRRVIVIDPGHGGKDKGAPNPINGGHEKDYTLDWARRVQSLLATNGWRVLLTRTNDMDLSLADRVTLAEKARADLFVSLHFNSVQSEHAGPDHNGVETYCLTPTGMPSNLLRNYADNLSLVFPNNAHDAQNLQYAFRLHEAMVQFTGRKDRGIRRARFMGVLRGQNRPAVLLEAGYLSDPEEGRLIASAVYRQKLALAVASALMD